MSWSDSALAGTTGVVFAGGRGMRMGGRDKGLEPLRGYPMVIHVLTRFAPQVDTICISANRHQATYADLGYRVLSDIVEGFAGPLAGLHAALTLTDSPLVATVPCDAPALPLDLVSRLREALDAQSADVAVAVAAGQVQPVFLLVRRSLCASVEAFLARGERKVDLWLDSVRTVKVPFSDPNAFANVNTPADLDALQ